MLIPRSLTAMLKECKLHCIMTSKRENNFHSKRFKQFLLFELTELIYLNNFSAKYFMLSLERGLPVTALNFKFKALVILPQVTLSGTTNGFRPGSANALSHVMVAQACGSWLP